MIMQKEETLKVETITVDEGKTLYRWMPRAMGRATTIRKRTSHVKIILTGEIDEKVKKQLNQENSRSLSRV